MKRTNVILFTALSILSLGLSSISLTKTEEVKVVYAYTNGDGATYYKSVESATDSELLSALQALNIQKRQNLVGYGSMPSKFQFTDPGDSSGEVRSFYSGKSAQYSGNMNREHTWPASRTVGGRGNDPLEDDIHMTRPTLTSENSSRGNSFYTDASEAGWDPATFNNESYRGDSARIIFYCVVADSRLSLVDKEYDSSANHTMGKLSRLLEWNLKYPVADREKTRNEVAESYQGNRNPFIDHPEYACRIWGNYNSTTKQICGSVTPPDPVEEELSDIELNVETLSLNVGQTYQLTVSPVPSSVELPNLLWGSTNKDVATVDQNGLVTAIKGGEAKINVITEDGKFMKSCVVSVAPNGKAKAQGCGGNIVTTSVILTTVSFVGIGLIAITKIKRKED